MASGLRQANHPPRGSFKAPQGARLTSVPKTSRRDTLPLAQRIGRATFKEAAFLNCQLWLLIALKWSRRMRFSSSTVSGFWQAVTCWAVTMRSETAPAR